jgi:uncharacterized protein YndB with AHSA1/START domain
MNERSVKHSTFVIERNYEALPAKVFAAWSDPVAKARWFPKADKFDFQVGGSGRPSLYLRRMLSRDRARSAHRLLLHSGSG